MLIVWSAAPEKSARHLNGRRRANSSATNNSRTTSPRPSTGRSGHSRASSEFSTTFLKEYTEGPSHGQSRLSRSPINPVLGTLTLNSSPISPLQTGALSLDTRSQRGAGAMPQITLSSTAAPYLEVVSTSPFSMQQPQLLRQGHNGSLRSNSVSSHEPDRARNSFLDMDDDDTLKDPDDIPILEREGGVDEFEEGSEKPVQSKGYTWDELVDRLLRQTMSRVDLDFTTIFLCFFRKFAPPRDLLNSILDRFDKANSDVIVLHRISAQLRYCNILHQWVSSHPGDFAHPKTRQRLTNFLNVISSNRSLALLAGEVRQTLAQGAEDEDNVWAISDSDTERRDSLRSFLDTHSLSHDSLSTLDGASEALRVPGTELHGRRASEALTLSTVNSFVSQTPSRGDPSGAIGPSSAWRDQYDMFMSIPDKEIAIELTRIDWSEFSQIKPRDLVRHVSIPADQKEKYPSLKHVNRMISHFNHVAYWVASVILEKPKPKHRARALEKFMAIAWVRLSGLSHVLAVLTCITDTPTHE